MFLPSLWASLAIATVPTFCCGKTSHSQTRLYPQTLVDLWTLAWVQLGHWPKHSIKPEDWRHGWWYCDLHFPLFGKLFVLGFVSYDIWSQRGWPWDWNWGNQIVWRPVKSLQAWDWRCYKISTLLNEHKSQHYIGWRDTFQTPTIPVVGLMESFRVGGLTWFTWQLVFFLFLIL